MNSGEQGTNKAMTKKPGMFWSGETLSQRLTTLIDPFDSGQIDCAASLVSHSLRPRPARVAAGRGLVANGW